MTEEQRREVSDFYFNHYRTHFRVWPQLADALASIPQARRPAPRAVWCPLRRAQTGSLHPPLRPGLWATRGTCYPSAPFQPGGARWVHVDQTSHWRPLPEEGRDAGDHL